MAKPNSPISHGGFVSHGNTTLKLNAGTKMTSETKKDGPETLSRIYHLFRDFFDKAEKKRRWNLREDIPWDQCNPHLNPAIADVVQTFCSVELFLPDYL